LFALASLGKATPICTRKSSPRHSRNSRAPCSRQMRPARRAIFSYSAIFFFGTGRAKPAAERAARPGLRRLLVPQGRTRPGPGAATLREGRIPCCDSCRFAGRSRQVAPPLLRLGEALQLEVARVEEAAQVAREEEELGEAAREGERRGVVEDVAHQRAARAVVAELVVVVEAGERPADLRVAEAVRPVEGGDPAREAQPQAEVARLPGDLLAELEQPARPAGDGPLARAGGGAEM